MPFSDPRWQATAAGLITGALFQLLGLVAKLAPQPLDKRPFRYALLQYLIGVAFGSVVSFMGYSVAGHFLVRWGFDSWALGALLGSIAAPLAPGLVDSLARRANKKVGGEA